MYSCTCNLSSRHPPFFWRPRIRRRWCLCKKSLIDNTADLTSIIFVEVPKLTLEMISSYKQRTIMLILRHQNDPHCELIQEGCAELNQVSWWNQVQPVIHHYHVQEESLVVTLNKAWNKIECLSEASGRTMFFFIKYFFVPHHTFLFLLSSQE